MPWITSVGTSIEPSRARHPSPISTRYGFVTIGATEAARSTTRSASARMAASSYSRERAQ